MENLEKDFDNIMQKIKDLSVNIFIFYFISVIKRENLLKMLFETKSLLYI